jgi:hypothetical protein
VNVEGCVSPFFITITKCLWLGNLIKKRGLFWLMGLVQGEGPHLVLVFLLAQS